MNGQEDVVKQIIEISPDVIVLDIMLPNKDGWEILSELKNNVETKKIPVIMASVLNEKNLAYRMKVDEYLTKPFTQEDLFETINRIISRKDDFEVLIADDDENFLNLISQFLNEESISFRVARDGEAAIEKLLAKKPDLLILDVTMPKKDGFKVIDNIRKIEKIKDTPTIVVTSKDLTNQEKEELLNNADLLLKKSGTLIDEVMEILVKRIREKVNGQKNSIG